MNAIRPLLPTDSDEWLRMRIALWPDALPEELADEVRTFFEKSGSDAVLVYPRQDGGLCGLIEVSIRPWAEGCRSEGVGYIEGWYVDPDMRRRGIGQALVQAGEEWARLQGCTEMASDTWIDNEASIHAHRTFGYDEVERVVLFRKDLQKR